MVMEPDAVLGQILVLHLRVADAGVEVADMLCPGDVLQRLIEPPAQSGSALGAVQIDRGLLSRVRRMRERNSSTLGTSYSKVMAVSST